MDLQKLINDTVNEMVDLKPRFDILFVSDETSRLSYVRGIEAMTEFRHFYGNLANVSVTTMNSKRFCELSPDMSKYNVLWIDNVINRQFNGMVSSAVRTAMDTLLPEWQDELAKVDGQEKDKLGSLMDEYRALKLRVVYCLDEFYWDAPAGRQKTVIDGMTVQDAMEMADSVIVPNVEMASAIKELQLVPESKEVLVIPTFVSDTFYPVHAVIKKSGSGITSIRKPKILVKGATLSKNAQNFIIHSTDDYDFTISSVGEIDDRLAKLLRTPKSRKEDRIPLVQNIQHWSSPYVNAKNMQATMAMERDAKFDFVIICEPDDIASDFYHLTITDTDALLGVASGSVVIAEVDDAEFGKGVHLCAETGLTFGKSTHVDELRELIERWRPTAEWDKAYELQRSLLQQRLVSSEAVMAGYFHAMLGRIVSDAKKNKYGEENA